MKKRAKATSFIKNSKNAVFALLLIAAAVAVYGIVNAATVSHTPSAIQPQGAGSTLDSDKLQGLTAADILAAGGGGSSAGNSAYYLICGLKVPSQCICNYPPSQSCEPPACSPGDLSVGTGCAYTAYDTSANANTYNCGGDCSFYRGFAGYCQRTCKPAEQGGVVQSGTTIFYSTKTTYNGNLGGRGGADSKCTAQLPPELSGKVSNIHAFLSVSGNDEIRDMHTADSDNDGTALGYYETANTIYGYNRYWSEWTILASNWKDLTDGSINANLAAALGFDGERYWTGSTSTGAFIDPYNNCDGWTSTAYCRGTSCFGELGLSTSTGTAWLYYTRLYCAQASYLLCAAKYTG